MKVLTIALIFNFILSLWPKSGLIIRVKGYKISISLKLTISGEILVRFGSNKNNRKSYSIKRLLNIVSESVGAFVTSLVTICKVQFCKNLPYFMNYLSDLDQIKINGKL